MKERVKTFKVSIDAKSTKLESKFEEELSSSISFAENVTKHAKEYDWDACKGGAAHGYDRSKSRQL